MIKTSKMRYKNLLKAFEVMTKAEYRKDLFVKWSIVEGILANTKRKLYSYEILKEKGAHHSLCKYINIQNNLVGRFIPGYTTHFD
jgi:hypothetical protein